MLTFSSLLILEYYSSHLQSGIILHVIYFSKAVLSEGTKNERISERKYRTTFKPT